MRGKLEIMKATNCTFQSDQIQETMLPMRSMNTKPETAGSKLCLNSTGWLSWDSFWVVQNKKLLTMKISQVSKRGSCTNGSNMFNIVQPWTGSYYSRVSICLISPKSKRPCSGQTMIQNGHCQPFALWCNHSTGFESVLEPAILISSKIMAKYGKQFLVPYAFFFDPWRRPLGRQTQHNDHDQHREGMS